MNLKISNLKPFGIVVESLIADEPLLSLDIENLKNLFFENQLIVLRGFKKIQSSIDFEKFCELWGEISVWPFGKILELQEQENPKDHIFDNSYVPLHWDGMYRPHVPEYQIFHCVKAPDIGHGGRTIFSNTIKTIENASKQQKETWSKITGIYERQMEYYNSKTISPILTKHPFRDFQVIRYNEPTDFEQGPFINPPNLHFTGVDPSTLPTFHQDMKDALYSSENCYRHTWRSGDIVIADNFSLLHGRERFRSQSSRHLQRAQVLSNPPFKNPSLRSYK